MSGRDGYYREGDWNAVCFECGRKFKASELKRSWKGYYVCPTHWEPRQPQDFVRGIPDNPSVPWVQSPVMIEVPTCFPNGRSAVPGYATPGCFMPSYLAPGNTIPFYFGA